MDPCRKALSNRPSSPGTCRIFALHLLPLGEDPRSSWNLLCVRRDAFDTENIKQHVNWRPPPQDRDLSHAKAHRVRVSLLFHEGGKFNKSQFVGGYGSSFPWQCSGCLKSAGG